jgi:hypothetical protein
LELLELEPLLELLFELLFELEPVDVLVWFVVLCADVPECPVCDTVWCVTVVPPPDVAACAACVEPGRAKATAPAATTLANPTAVVAAFIRR